MACAVLFAVPVMVMTCDPVGVPFAPELVVMVNVELIGFAPGETPLGENEHLVPAGKFEQERETLLL